MFAMPEVKIAALVMNYDRSTVCGSSTLFLFFSDPRCGSIGPVMAVTV